MNAAEALKAAQVAGVRIMADGGNLLLDADAPPPLPILKALRRYKTEIVKLLGSGSEGWTADDWRQFFDERAAIAELDGGLPRAVAEARALECCVVQWMNRHGPRPTDPGSGCGHCGEPMSESDSLPFLTGCGHIWLHCSCHGPWIAKLRSEAVEALAAMGTRSGATGQARGADDD